MSFKHRIVTLAISVTGFVLIVLYEKTAFERQGIYLSLTRLISDACFIVGVAFLSLGGLSFVANNGGFDAFNYAVAKMIDRIKHPKITERDRESYYDYVQKKRKPASKHFIFILFLGILYTVLSIIFAVI